MRCAIKNKSPINAAKHFPIVCIGASAGGLKAIISLFSSIHKNPGMAFVVIQHLEPAHESILPEIIGRNSALKVYQVKNRMKIKPDIIYVIPPNSNISLKGDSFAVTPRRGKNTGIYKPIDFFLQSISEAQKERIIAIILSGTGSDGSSGIKGIKEHGGAVFAQDMGSAEYYSMPESAISTGVVDFVLPPDKIAEKLGEMKRRRYAVPVMPALEYGETAHTGGLEKIFGILQSAAGVNFEHYKRSTILRRIARRMEINKTKNYGSYINLMEKNPEEAKQLYKDLLISVTYFFREQKTFKALTSIVFPEIALKRPSRDPIRVWVPGCSTGEEVYSIAILLYEFLEAGKYNIPVQIFGTDLNESLVDRARTGRYPREIASDMPPKTLKRFFTRDADGYKINRKIRDMCIFSRQNITVDPPLSNMDIISFRNVLIYMDQALQKKIIPLLHYALKPSGFLLLGQSETIGEFTGLFKQADKTNKVYRKRSMMYGDRKPFDGGRNPDKYIKPIRFDGGDKKAGTEAESQFDPGREAERTLVEKYGANSILIDGEHRILQFGAGTGQYINPAPGKANLNVMNMVMGDLKPALLGTLKIAADTGDTARSSKIKTVINGETVQVFIEIIPVRGPAQGKRFYLIVFHGNESPAHGAARGGKKTRGTAVTDREAGRLKKEIRATREYLQSIVEAKEAANEELKSANEEIQSSNEELRSMNEEMETAKEELQSTNEELTTVNEELKRKNTDLITVNDDMRNVFDTIDMPVIIVDSALCVKRFTPASKKVFNLIPSDIGRPLGDIKSKLNIPDLDGLIRDAVENLRQSSTEIYGQEERWYSLNIRPYRTLENKIDGAVLLINDISAVKQMQLYLNNIVETVREPLIVLDGQMKAISANKSFFDTFRAVPDEVIGQYFFEIWDLRWETQELKKLLKNTIINNAPFVDYKMTINTKKTGKRELLLNGRQILHDSESTGLILLAVEDVTEKVKKAAAFERMQKDLMASKRRADIGDLAATIAHELRNPLAAIHAAAYNIRKKADSPELRSHIETLNKKVDESSQIINNLLQYAKIKLPQFENVRLCEQIEEAVLAAKSRFSPRHAPVSFKCGLRRDFAVEMDPFQIKLVFVNILVNGFQALPERNGRININVKMAGDNSVAVSFEDNGRGISKEILGKIFDPFYTSKAKGTGLGLTISNELVRLHNGRIDVKSARRGKTTFTVTLPVIREPAAPGPYR